MSIATRTGDGGETSLTGNRRVFKTHPRIEICGTIDELNASLGVVRSQAGQTWLAKRIGQIQDLLIPLMGELATESDDRGRYFQKGFRRVDEEFVTIVDSLVARLEASGLSFSGWARPGDSAISAGLDVARCVCRRAERQVCGLMESGLEPNREIQRFLNRLSDGLWLLARWDESGRPTLEPE